MKTVKRLLLAILGVWFLASSAAVYSKTVPQNLTVNLRKNPIGIDSRPCFSWDPQVQKQTAYQVLVAESIKELESAKCVWNSGKINSSNDLQINYEGPALKSATRYYWRVFVWDGKGQKYESDIYWWETGLLNNTDWEPAKWISGRHPQDHNWQDMTATINFRITDTTAGINFFFHAEPVGKTWGEAYSWKINGNKDAGMVQLMLSTIHYAGNTGVPEPAAGENPVQWGVNYFDPQSVTNPMKVGTRKVEIETISADKLGEMNYDNLLTTDHELKVKIAGANITTWIDGIQVDQRTLSGDQLRKNGSIGFESGSHAIVRNVKVEVPENTDGKGSRNGFFTDFYGGFNPFEDGIVNWTGIHGNQNTDGLKLTKGKGIMLPISNPAPIIRKEFRTSLSSVKSARLYITGGSYPKVTVNGFSVTIDGELPDQYGHNIPHLTPDDGQSESFILYNTFDVTKLIKAGGYNVIAAELGRGWTGVTVPSEWYWNLIPAHSDPRTKARLIITHEDGTQEIVVSDDSWKTTDGPVIFNSVHTGDKYDARKAKELGNWKITGYDDSKWRNVTIMNPMGSYYGTGRYNGLVPATGKLTEGFIESKLKAMENEPIMVREIMKPVEILETYPGSKVYLFKFSQMHTGWLKLHLTNIKPEYAGLTLRMRGDNIIKGKGTPDDPYTLSDSKQYIAGSIQTDYYILSDEPEQTWSPDFHYNGQGGIEVYGLYNILGREPDMEQDADLIVAEIASSGFQFNSVVTSNNLLNQIFSLCQWTMLNNAHGHPTDTPSREKNGWTGDGWADSEAWMNNFDVSQFYRLWVRDMAAGMNPEGDLNVVMPGPRAYGFDNTPGWNMANGAVPAWDHAFFEVPLDLYRYYGDETILEEIYPMQEKFMEYYSGRFTKENNFTYSNMFLGEYASGTLPPGSTQNINHQLYFRMASYLAKISSMLGYEEKAKKYQSLANEVLKVFVRLYWDESTHSFQKGNSGNLETEQILAVAYDMVPGNDLPEDDPRYLAETTNTLVQNMESCMAVVVNSIKSHNNRIGVGIYGLRYLFNLLDEYDHTNLAYSVATGIENPSWGNILLQGGTTLQENWGGIDGNHHYHSSIATWYYQGLAGIKPTSPGFRAVKIKPCIPTNQGNSNLKGEKTPLTHVSASVNTVRGIVKSVWSNTDSFVLNITIPNNTEAEIWIPSVSGKVSGIPDGTKHQRNKAGYVVFNVGAGEYEFITEKVE
ncbi:MAG: alpha-L-rhamnosidase N-terminal domain-containing protein [Bacteroidales bacterium]|nr:alpha-L-rhamnosidase N-terminal domain-containing protein [Bacteroidales bacterium]